MEQTISPPDKAPVLRPGLISLIQVARVMAHLTARPRARVLSYSWGIAGALIAAVAVTVGVRVWWSLRLPTEDVVAVGRFPPAGRPPEKSPRSVWTLMRSE